MNDFLTSNSINIWPAVGLALGFPLILLFLNELISSLERRGNPLARTLRTFRNFVVPALAVVVFIVYIVEAPAGGWDVFGCEFWPLCFASLKIYGGGVGRLIIISH